MRVETIRCDNCDKARDKDTNHWSQIIGMSIGMTVKRGVITADSLPSGPATAFGYTLTDPADACGEDCRHALMSRYLATGSFARSPALKASSRP